MKFVRFMYFKDIVFIFHVLHLFANYVFYSL